MGQEQSNHIDPSVPPKRLESRSLDAVAHLILSGRARKIVAMTGAGLSTAAGIPDFRSPGTGLYANLQHLNLPSAEAIFDIEYFRRRPRPFYVLAKELYPGRFHPTISHAFLALLERKNLLHLLFTQNIDCLERAAGISPDRIVEAHGSFASQRCIDCGRPYDAAAMRRHVEETSVPHCPDCPVTDPFSGQPLRGLVKPDIVFFGESLPARFHEKSRVTPAYDGTDLVLVLGTSLTVYPFAGLPALAADGVPRVLFNREPVGDLGSRSDDVLVLGSCDAGVRKLAAALGWADELEQFWRDLVGDAEADRQRAQDGLLVTDPRENWGAVDSSSSSEGEGEGEGESESECEDANKGKDDGENEDKSTATEAGIASSRDESASAEKKEEPLSAAEEEVREITTAIEAALRLDGEKDKTVTEKVGEVETKDSPENEQTKDTKETAPGEKPDTSTAGVPADEKETPTVSQKADTE